MAHKAIEIQQIIIDFLGQNPESSSMQIQLGMGEICSYATTKRALKTLKLAAQLHTTGNGKATKYAISPDYELQREIDIETYFTKELDERKIKKGFDFNLFSGVLKEKPLFSAAEENLLKQLQNEFNRNTEKLTEKEFLTEFERLAIDLSWKSSQIEGNTYSLLETERLLKEKETASGKNLDEATMLLNHKAALDFLLLNKNYVEPLTLAVIEDIHSLLIQNLSVERNLRRRKVGISGTNYVPLDNEFQIREALTDMCSLVNAKENIFEKALLVLLMISYIQPFADGNKRTARIISNAILMDHKHCPISFRTVNSLDYKKAMLIFYEQSNISAFKKIFIEQYDFAVKTYF